jgi:hypothetical protein
MSAITSSQQASGSGRDDRGPEAPGGKASVPKWLTGLAGNTLVATIAVGLGSALLIALRLISVAKFNIETTYGILQASGTGVIVVGTVIALIPGIAVTIACSSALIAIFCKLNAQTHFLLWMAITLFAVIAVLTTPLEYWWGILACVLILAGVRAFKKGFRSFSDGGRKLIAGVSAVLFAGLLMAGVVFGAPWGPEEMFTFTGKQQVTGYLLAQTDTVTTILQASPREVEYYDTSKLVTQAACKNVPWYSFSVIYFIPGFNPVHYAPCRS